MSGESCYLCGGVTFKLIHLDYYIATGKKKYPSVNSQNYDQRYGFWYHESCLTSEQKKRLEENNPMTREEK